VVKTGLFQDYPWWYRALIPLLILAFAQSALANAEPATLSLYCKDNRLTVSAKDVPLRAVLEKIAQQAGISIVLKGSAENRVSAEFSGIGIEEGIRRLTRGLSCVFLYDLKGGSTATWEMISVFLFAETGDQRVTTFAPGSSLEGPVTSGSEAILADSDEEGIDRLCVAAMDNEGAFSQLAELAIGGEDSEIRVRAVEALDRLGNERTRNPLIQALEDENAEVRVASVRALADFRDEKVTRALARAALEDDNPSVREEAVFALAQVGGKNATEALERALTDRVEFVRRVAAEALQGIER